MKLELFLGKNPLVSASKENGTVVGICGRIGGILASADGVAKGTGSSLIGGTSSFGKSPIKSSINAGGCPRVSLTFIPAIGDAPTISKGSSSSSSSGTDFPPP